METGEGQDIQSWYCDSDSDDSIVVTISQMQDEAAKLQSTAAEIREELSGLLATLDDIEHRATTDKRKKIPAKVKPESGDGICEDPSLPEPTCPAAMKGSEDGKEPGDSDDRYRDVSTAAAEPPRTGSRGDMAATDGGGEFKPFDAREILESLIDAVMERQSAGGDSLDVRPQQSPASKDEDQGAPKTCPGDEGQRSVGAVDAPAHSSDSDDHDVVVSGAGAGSPWEGVERRRLRRHRSKRGSDAGSSLGSVSSDARSSSTTDDAYLLDEDMAEGGTGDCDIDMIDDGGDGPYFLLD